MKNKRYIFIYIAIIVLYVIVIFSNLFLTDIISANNDIPSIDISNFKFEEHSIISLDGYWEKIDKDNNSTLCAYHDFANDTECENTTYSLTLILPEDEDMYSFLLPKVNSDYQFIINDKVIYDTNLQSDKSHIAKNTFLDNIALSGNTKLSIHFLNNSNNNKLFAQSFLFGSTESCRRYAYLKLIPILSLLVQIILGFMLYLALYINNSKNKEYLTFSLLCLSLLIRVFTANPTFFVLLFPNATHNIYYSLDGIAVVIPLFMLILHLDALFTNYLNYKIAVPVSFCIFAFIIAVFITPLEFIGIIQIAYFILSSSTLLLITITSLKAVIGKKPSAIINFTGIILISTGITYDTIQFNLNNGPSSYFLYAFSIYLALYVGLFIRERAKIYANETYLNEIYLSSISQIKSEETNYLSSHLRPHFLFNALNIISGYSLFDTEKAKGITSSLTMYLRQLFEHDNLKEMNSLENEMKLVKAFAYIELERFPGLSIEYDIPDVLPDIEIPSLTLQPLLENAINHGVRKKNTKGIGNVIISIREVKNYVYFSIKDNGAGEDEEKLKKAMTASIDGKFHTLTHISYRLKNLYNESITVRSINGVGTFLSFKIPRCLS